ncbi:helix-turn-helix domain-containing protein [Candidatus Palauibacter sp.]|uniref:helix-turn-helix domain-containing protein n=1 Tax=Candidatus Palauibacter sp. TaxID=3101350 RepID=UPI003AF30595
MAYNTHMSTTRVRIDPDDPGSLPEGRVDYPVLDSTAEADLISQQREDDAEAMRDMARFARRVRRRMGLTQVEFARRIDVSHETIRNWEQGKRGPTGAARTLLRILDKAPEVALRVLD